MLRLWAISLCAAFLAGVSAAQELRETAPAVWELEQIGTGERPAGETDAPPGDESEGEKAPEEEWSLHKLYEEEPAGGTEAASSEIGAAEKVGGLRDTLPIAGILFLLCGIIILLGYVVRRFGGRTPLLAGQRLGKVLGKVHLSPRASLHYVESGGRVLVIGVTPNDIRLLTEFNAEDFEAGLEGEAEEVEEGEGDAAPPSFLKQLRAGTAQLKRSSAAGIEEDLSSLRGEIRQLQEHLQGGRSEPTE